MSTYAQFIQFGPYFSGGSLCTLRVYHYVVGTTTLKDVYTDREKTTTAAQPLVSDSEGVAFCYADGLYKFRIDVATDGVNYSTLYTQDKWAVTDQSDTLSGEGAAIASSSTLTLGTDGNIFHVTGSTGPITALSGNQSTVTLVFDSTPTLTHSGTLILQNGENYTVAANTSMTFFNEGSSVWRETMRTPNRDSGFRILGSADATKQLAFEVDGFTTTTTRTLTVQDKDGTIALTTDAFTTGDVKLTLKTTADATWVLMNDGSIGNAASGATTRANADTVALYTLIYDNVTNDWAPVATGRGASAAADYAANKALTLPKSLGRALAGYGTGTVVASGVDADVDTGAANSLTVASNNTKWITGMSVVFTLTSGTITGLISSTTYYVIRSSATLVKLASTLALAQAGTEIDLTAKSSPVWTITHTYTARVLGEAVGEQSHAMSSTELLAHTHDPTSGGPFGIHDESPASFGINYGAAATEAWTPMISKGGNAAMNIQSPTLFLNVMVKL